MVRQSLIKSSPVSLWNIQCNGCDKQGERERERGEREREQAGWGTERRVMCTNGKSVS